MVGSGLKKLAATHNMRIDRGVAYGSMFGYATTLSEGSGYKRIHITTTFIEPANQQSLQTAVGTKNLNKEFRVQEINFFDNYIDIIFFDNPGTMKKITSFIDYFYPLLDAHEATKANICTECGCEIESGQWKLVNGAAFYLHSGCAQKVELVIAHAEETRRNEDTGSYISGFLGALLGAAFGAVLWAIVLYLGYVAAIVGFLIGWLAEKAYNLLHGKQGKGKIVILLIAVVFGVALGTALGETFLLTNMINSGELAGFTFSDMPLLLLILLADSEYMSIVAGNIVIGLLFAALGVFSLIIKTKNEISGVKVIDLK